MAPSVLFVRLRRAVMFVTFIRAGRHYLGWSCWARPVEPPFQKPNTFHRPHPVDGSASRLNTVLAPEAGASSSGAQDPRGDMPLVLDIRSGWLASETTKSIASRAPNPHARWLRWKGVRLTTRAIPIRAALAAVLATLSSALKRSTGGAERGESLQRLLTAALPLLVVVFAAGGALLYDSAVHVIFDPAKASRLAVPESQEAPPAFNPSTAQTAPDAPIVTAALRASTAPPASDSQTSNDTPYSSQYQPTAAHLIATFLPAEVRGLPRPSWSYSVPALYNPVLESYGKPASYNDSASLGLTSAQLADWARNRPAPRQVQPQETASTPPVPPQHSTPLAYEPTPVALAPAAQLSRSDDPPPAPYGTDQRSAIYAELIRAGEAMRQRQDFAGAYRLASQAKALNPDGLPALELEQMTLAADGDPRQAEIAALAVLARGGTAVFEVQHYHPAQRSAHPARIVITPTSLQFIPEAPCAAGQRSIPLASVRSLLMRQNASAPGPNLLNIEFEGGTLSLAPFGPAKSSGVTSASATQPTLLTAIRNVLATTKAGR